MAKRITEEQLREKEDNQGRPVTFVEASMRFVGDTGDPDRSLAVQTHFAPGERRKQRNLKAKARRIAQKAELEQLKAKAGETEADVAQG